MSKKLIIMVSILFILCPIYSFAQDVSVSLPRYSVVLNDIKVDNAHSKYPLVVYKGITYFPMTFYQCRFMGIESKWTDGEGLEINKSGVIGEYRPNLINGKNNRSYKANIADFNIKVNGKIIDNSKEKYPLIVLNNVTYFPMTWKFVVDEFGWDYKFDSKKGLYIKSRKLEVKKWDLPYEDIYGNICMYNGYYYYVVNIKNKKYVYSAKVDNTKKASKLCELKGDLIVGGSFFKQDGEVCFKYHSGIVSMGCDYTYKIKKDNTVEFVTSGYFKNIKYKDRIICYDYGPLASDGNLYYEEEDYKREYIGNKEYMYRYHKIIGDNMYVTAYKPGNKNDENKIYKINMNTNEMEQLSYVEAHEFYIVDDKIYFKSDKDKKIYSMGLNGENQNVVIDGDVGWFKIDNDTIYYISDKTEEIFYKKVGEKSKLLMKKQKVVEIDLRSDYIICTLRDKEDYGIVVFDKNQNVVFKTSDKVESYWSDEDYIIYNTYDTNNNYIVRLK
ncbi:DUF5050 domain-containing protein [Tepidibacter hydrothermalis]|uniref:DUF5050 domain-containing protein n=1 Tax=Tepidibacter hydrothermalis TaxID=3036126 RepID=A0ABY8ED29_9FIRM|nr:DUF5050 domain-containing protein [Tepidibacter hydrothermalis]WFD09402.1 DUF5050 domain-containing protein [Tepidibacter hydrothermalis]